MAQTRNLRMGKKEKRQLSIMIIEDEQDILLLYKDYLMSRGHKVLATSTTANEIMSDYDRIKPDIAIIDTVKKEIANNSFFDNKRVEILIKPLRLSQLESSIINMVNK